MQEFLVCPNCGDPDERRTTCKRCGYVAQDRTTARASRSSKPSSGSLFGGFGGLLRLLAVGVGMAMFIGGCREYRLGANTSAVPQDVDLAALEAGGPRPQNYVRIGKHYRVYAEALQVTVKNKRTQTTISDDVYYYPIVSAEHPLIRKGTGKDTEAKAPETFAVLVRHKGPLDVKLGTQQPQPADAIEGLIVSDLDSLEKDGEALLRQTFPKFDSNHVLILEEGAKPTSPVTSIALMVGGVLIALATIVLFFVRRASGDEE